MRARASALVALVAIALAIAPIHARADLDPIAYTVSAGDTAHRIASRHGLSLSELRALNEGADLEHLRVGQELVIGAGRLVVHRVRAGETLGAISERYGVRTREILGWNEGIRAERIAVDRELRIWARRDEPQSESVGRPDAGALVHGIVIPPHPAYVVRDEARAFVTREVADTLMRGFEAVRAVRTDAPRVEIRDASRRDGGHMREHRSHQSGRDVDFAYYRRRCSGGTCGHHWVTPEQLDAELEWALLEPWIRSGAVEYVFVDHALQRPLYDAARAAGASRTELFTWFQWPRAADVRAGVVRHVPRHTEHLHVRFACAARDARCGATEESD